MQGIFPTWICEFVQVSIAHNIHFPSFGQVTQEVVCKVSQAPVQAEISRFQANQYMPYIRPMLRMPVSAGSRVEDLIEVKLSVFSLLNSPFFSDDAINQIMASNIECRIPSASEVRRNSNLLNVTFNFQASVL